MLKTNFCRYVCLLVSLVVLVSEVHAVKSLYSPYKYIVEATNTFRSTPNMRAHPEDSKLFTFEGTFNPRNDAVVNDFGTEIKTVASGLNKEQQDIEVIADNVKWAARVNQGIVEDVECSWVGPLNVAPVQAYMSQLTKTKGTDIPSHIKSLVLKIYKYCKNDCELIERPHDKHRHGYKNFDHIWEFD